MRKQQRTALCNPRREASEQPSLTASPSRTSGLQTVREQRLFKLPLQWCWWQHLWPINTERRAGRGRDSGVVGDRTREKAKLGHRRGQLQPGPTGSKCELTLFQSPGSCEPQAQHTAGVGATAQQMGSSWGPTRPLPHAGQLWLAAQRWLSEVDGSLL